MLSQIQLLTSKILHICQEIRDIKSQRRPQTNIAIQNYTNIGLVEEQTNWNYTWEPDSSNSAKEGSDGVDGLGETVELEADHRSYGSPAIAHKRAEHSALKPIDQINLRLVHHELYCAT